MYMVVEQVMMMMMRMSRRTCVQLSDVIEVENPIYKIGILKSRTRGPKDKDLRICEVGYGLYEGLRVWG